MLRVLTFTNLYPNAAQPRHGIFVEQRLLRLVQSGSIAARVIAPVASFPVRRGRFAPFAVAARVAAAEHRHGIEVEHPRFPVVPGLSSWVNPVSMALCALPALRRMRRESGEFDLIDAQFVYPDGVAGALLGALLGKPVLITARGSDVNLAGRERIPRAWIRWAARRCAGFITVSEALRDALLALGVPTEQLIVLRNGVDLELFQPQDRERARAELGISGPMLLAVGNLVEEKGHDIEIRALAELAGVRLTIIGSGPEGENLRRLAHECGVSERITWISELRQPALVRYYAAADATVLASSREGMANVLLESIACGTPVIASAVGGNPEIVSTSHAGVLMAERTPAALVTAFRQLQRERPDSAQVRRHAQRFGWEETITRQLRLFHDVASRGPAARGLRAA
ncbi:MAG TPA: glycosyltransferase [Steroidobacteraceae bacterium]